MVKKFVSIFLLVGACLAYPYPIEDDVRPSNEVEGPVGLTQLASVPVPQQVQESVDPGQPGPVPEGSDLKTDSSRWWRRSHYPSYYPRYYYRPRYYSYYNDYNPYYWNSYYW